MNNPSPENPNPFGHHTVSLRAQFTRDGAAPSIANSTALASPNQVMIPAALVPEGTSAPGFPYEHIAQAIFTRDQDDISNSTGTNPQQPRPPDTPARMQRNPPPRYKTQRDPRQFATAFPSASKSGLLAPSDVGSGSESAAPRPGRSVRSAQANFSAAAPQPQLDNSRDAIEAAVRALRTLPSDELA